MRVQIVGEINDESFSRFTRKIRRLESEFESSFEGEQLEVELEIISEGGSATAALAFFDFITNNQSVVFTGIATGQVASAATLIFMACDKRYMTDNAWLMVHEDSVSGIDDKQIHQLEKEIKHSRRMEEQWCRLMASVSTVSYETWVELNKAETYLDKKDCLLLGILDEGKE